MIVVVDRALVSGEVTEVSIIKVVFDQEGVIEIIDDRVGDAGLARRRAARDADDDGCRRIAGPLAVSEGVDGHDGA